jgi:phosphoenolpyruvate-protein kinase (PTS system EI component)
VSNIVSQLALVALQYGEVARKQAEEEILAVCRDLLPASDVDAIESRLREGRVGSETTRPSHLAVAARAQTPSTSTERPV